MGVRNESYMKETPDDNGLYQVSQIEYQDKTVVAHLVFLFLPLLNEYICVVRYPNRTMPPGYGPKGVKKEVT
jgi:hypothetical protein